MKIDEIQDKVISEFSECGNWFERYERLVELARGLEPMDPAHKTESNSIGGCQSELWVYGKCADGRMEFSADSDAVITKGIVSLILRVVNHQTPADILKADLYFIDRIGLKSNLSPARSNGINSIINAVKESADAVKEDCGTRGA